MDLLIVESPAKAKTIKKYLGSGYNVVASMGHLRDLPKSTMGVDIENNFEPKYIEIRGKGPIIKELRSEAKKSNKIYLATDPDREGEAIAWHLKTLLNLSGKEALRVTFNEITKNAVCEGVKNPRAIDENLVDAQQARRVLDRIVGYKLSPFLWKKIRRGLSAGRVQSVATRLIVEREQEIRDFVPKEFWNLDVDLQKISGDGTFTARYYGKHPEMKRRELNSAQDVEEALSGIEDGRFIVKTVKRGERIKNPAAPFITSTLQQESSRRLGFAPRRTMIIAQALYEGVNITGRGLTGLITYMRTDSLRLSNEAIEGVRKYISSRYGEDYLPPAPRVFKSRAASQDAHEAIRPTDPSLAPEQVKDSLSPEQYKLYKLIWERFTACQMASAVHDTVVADIVSGSEAFRASGYTVRFLGFTVLYEESREDDKDKEDEGSTALPQLQEGEELRLLKLQKEQKFTSPPPRFTEATLIREMEECGVGRPSTYAPTITTITEREYVEREGRALKPTPLGEVVTELMKKQFPDVVDIAFTARMENDLDKVEEGSAGWKETVAAFYEGFHRELDQAEQVMGDERLKVPVEETDVECELCGRKMVIKYGRFGKFMACPGYPECKNVKSIAEETPGLCPLCGSKVLKKKSKNKNTYYGCAAYPNCGFMTWDAPQKEMCPKCGKTLFKKSPRMGGDIYCAAEGCGYVQEKPAKTAKKPKAETTKTKKVPAKAKNKA